ncbi:MAG: response regulator transcription factor [Alphaproteobacteria bacterium]|nr:response regulator transcription factor [Alphaproteobacteria bacterium]
MSAIGSRIAIWCGTSLREKNYQNTRKLAKKPVQGRNSDKIIVEEGMKILIADDHQLLADALAQLVRENDSGAEVLQATSLAGAMDAMDQDGAVEIVLLDYDLPGMDGIKGLDKIRGRFPKIPCAIFSGAPDAQVASSALARGAAGFIPKSLSAPAFFHAIKLMQVGEKFIPAELYENIAHRTEIVQAASRSAGEFIAERSLSRRESEVLASLVKGISNREIGEELGVEEVTVKLHLRRIYRKIGVVNRTQAVKLAMANGIG